jgi:uncharacterized protein (TIGR03437 family)
MAPGELITLFVPSLGSAVKSAVKAPPGPLPLTLAGVTVTFRQGTDRPIPIALVQPLSSCTGTDVCGSTLAVTVQLPFEAVAICPLCERPSFVSTQLAVTVNGVQSQFVDVTVPPNHVHFLTQCDVTLPDFATAVVNAPLPCAPMVTHADGKLITATNPAAPGEEVVAYVTGLGQTDPALPTGQPATAPTRAGQFFIDFNFHANALASVPTATSAAPAYAGAVTGFVGLYQVNFVVPAFPAGTISCGALPVAFPLFGIVQSNLTVSIGSMFSYDGVGICVRP